MCFSSYYFFSFTEYEELAVSLALDSDRLYSMRQHLEQTRTTSALFDTMRWISNFESALFKVYKKYELGYSPDHIEIEDKAPIFTKNQNIFE
jgi:hypothetical protein